MSTYNSHPFQFALDKYFRKGTDWAILHSTANPSNVFPRNKLLSLVPNSYIHVSVSDLYISRIGLPIWLPNWLQQNRQINPGNISIAHRYMNVEIGRQNIIILFWQFHFWEYINRNQTFISDSPRPFILQCRPSLGLPWTHQGPTLSPPSA